MAVIVRVLQQGPKWKLAPTPEDYNYSSARFYAECVDELKILTSYLSDWLNRCSSFNSYYSLPSRLLEGFPKTAEPQVIIADITGKVIFTTIATDTQKVEINTKDFKKGVYLVDVQTANFIGTKKLVVEKES